MLRVARQPIVQIWAWPLLYVLQASNSNMLHAVFLWKFDYVGIPYLASHTNYFRVAFGSTCQNVIV